MLIILNERLDKDVKESRFYATTLVMCEVKTQREKSSFLSHLAQVLYLD